jgi:hypothetical protein
MVERKRDARAISLTVLLSFTRRDRTRPPWELVSSASPWTPPIAADAASDRGSPPEMSGPQGDTGARPLPEVNVGSGWNKIGPDGGSDQKG